MQHVSDTDRCGRLRSRGLQQKLKNLILLALGKRHDCSIDLDGTVPCEIVIEKLNTMVPYQQTRLRGSHRLDTPPQVCQMRVKRVLAWRCCTHGPSPLIGR